MQARLKIRSTLDEIQSIQFWSQNSAEQKINTRVLFHKLTHRVSQLVHLAALFRPPGTELQELGQFL